MERAIPVFTSDVWPSALANTRVTVLRRKRADVAGPFLIFVLAFGNLSFQIVAPATQEDEHSSGIYFLALRAYIPIA